MPGTISSRTKLCRQHGFIDWHTERSWAWALLSLFAGGMTTLAFAPFDLVPLVFIAVAIMLVLWLKLPHRKAVLSAWLFSMGLQMSGVSWIFHSLHTHGNAPAWFSIILIFLLACYLSIYPALAVYAVRRFLPAKEPVRLLLLFPVSWVLFEWLQGYVMTGFSWMQLGYTQLDTALSGFAPVMGSHAVSGLVVSSAGFLALLYLNRAWLPQVVSRDRRLLMALAVLVMIWAGGAVLKTIDWTRAEGEPLRVSVIQGNIEQSIKWKQHMKQPTLNLYQRLTLEQQDADLVIWPETAVPDYRHRMQSYIKRLHRTLEQRDTELIFGIFIKQDGRLLNSAINTRGDAYSKRHLVPLGEYIPFRSLIAFFNRFVKIPMSDIASGDEDQPLMLAHGVPLGISICFEEAFSRDVIKDLPEAAILINMSNDAWFEDSHQLAQQNAIGRMRALEAGRYLIRSTNTGITSLIDPHGEVVDQLPPFEVGVLDVEVQPFAGATPFVNWGNGLAVALSVLCMLLWIYLGRPRGGT